MNSKVTTLVLFTRGDEVLLAMKKRGFGVGRWNGVGGKLDVGETIEQAVVRECQEEVGVTPVTYHKVAEHDFQEFHDGRSAHMLVHTYICTKWEGEPVESEEMAPRWFKITDVPYPEMWPDDPYWLPQVLEGKLLKTMFTLGEDDSLIAQEVQEVDSL